MPSEDLLAENRERRDGHEALPQGDVLEAAGHRQRPGRLLRDEALENERLADAPGTPTGGVRNPPKLLRSELALLYQNLPDAPRGRPARSATRRFSLRACYGPAPRTAFA
ncbi:MAG: hypothetical protein M3Q60_00170 [Actinomycetota bacterium]|nr:hypothetical protein [Actinomycetota bacterium]